MCSLGAYNDRVTIKQYAIGTFGACWMRIDVGCAPLFSDVLAVLIVYEYLITFDAEVDLIWKRKFTFVTVLWFFVGG